MSQPPAPEASDSGTPVFRLVYSSRSRIDAEDRRTELGDIFTVARRSNRSLGITGALMVTGDAFAQTCLLYTSPSPRDLSTSRMPSSA